MKNIFLLTLLTATSLSAQTVINVADHGAFPDDGGAYSADHSARAGDDTQPCKDAIAAAKAVGGPVTLLIPPGTYDFYPNNATSRICFTSNSTESSSDGTKTIAIDIVDVDDLTISGMGATMMMRGKMTMLVAEQCDNLTLQGLTFDFKRPTMSEITCVEVGGNYWIGAVHQDSDYAIVGSTIKWIGEGWTLYHNMTQHYDPESETTWRGGDPLSILTSIQDQGNRRLRFNGTASLGNAVVGRTYQFRNTTRNAVAMWFNHCTDVLMQDVTVRALHGFGILGQFSENITIERLKVEPDPESGRTNASAADVTHFSGCKGLVRIVDSVLSAAHDDAMNVHGTHLEIKEMPAANQARVRFGQHQSWGFQAYFPGDNIEFIDERTLLPHGSAMVTAVTMLADPKEQLLSFDQNIPGTVANGDVIEDVSWTPSVELINCDIKQIPTRGILLTTRRPILIQGNRFFRTQMHAILIEDDANGWFESGRVLDLAVRGNVFYECGEQVIKVDPVNSIHAGSVHENLRFEDNEFVMKGTGAFRLASCGNVTIRNNHFRMRNGSSTPVESMTSQSSVDGISFSGNISEPANNPAIEPDNGDFELPGVGSTATQAGVTNWLVSPGGATKGSTLTESDSAASYTASDTAFIPMGGVLVQRVGYYDPDQGSSLNWSLRQTTQVSPSVGSGAVRVALFQGDARFPEANEVDPEAEGLEQIGAETLSTSLGSLRLSRVVRGNIPLDGVGAGAELWIRIEAANQNATLDDVQINTADAPYQPGFTQWIADENIPAGSHSPDSDLDNDEVALLFEYAVGGRDPLFPEPESVVGLGDLPNGVGFFYLPSIRDDVEIRPGYRTNLVSGGWSLLEESTPGFTITPGSPVSIVPDLAVYNQVFWRAEATLIDPPPEPIDPLQVTNGEFGTVNVNATYVSGGGWFESSSTAWVEGSWPGSTASDTPMVLLMDNLGDGSYVYQSLGTVGTNTNLTIIADFIEKFDGNTNDARFDIYSGSFAGAADGNDISSAGLTLEGTYILNAAQQGLTAAAGNNSKSYAVTVGTLDISGLAGTELWIRITDATDGSDDSGSGGDLMIDNLRLGATP